MVDFVSWALADPLTAEQAAHLWAGVDPSSASGLPMSERNPAVAPYFQMLAGAISSGQLRADTSTNPMASIGAHKQTLIKRADLIAFANSKNEHPAFLFDTMQTAPGAATTRDAVIAPPKNPGGAPAKYDWNLFFLEIIRIAHEGNLPDTRAELAREMRDWFIEKIDDHPADTTIEDRIRPIYQYLEQYRKPSGK